MIATQASDGTPAHRQSAGARNPRSGDWTPQPPIRFRDDPAALRTGLRQLALLRGVATVGQASAIAVSAAVGVLIPVMPLAAIVAALVAFNVFSLLRLRATRAATAAELGMSLGVDLCGIAILLHLSGGADNPFVLLLVLHAVMMAMLLPLPGAAAGTLLIVAVYAEMLRVRNPLVMIDDGALSPALQAFGNAASFLVTAGITAWFVASTAHALRAHDRHLAEATRRSLRDDAVLRVGALAAGAAHELATPLTTVTVAADQILRHAADPGIRRDAQTIAVQAALCRDTVGQLVAAGGHARAVGPVRERFDALIERIAERSRMTHPGLAIESGWRGALPPPDVFLDEALRQALLSLVDNAADASPHDVSIFAQRVGESLRISVADRGPGIAAQDIARIGKEFYTTKRPGQGAGLGTVLALRAIEQIGGNLRWENRNGGGLIAEIDLPLALIAAENPA